MIRRGFWLVTGAVLGVSGYRRATRLARSLVPARPGARGAGPAGVRRPVLTGQRALAGAARAGHAAAESAAFVRDVKDGMTEYLDQRGSQTPYPRKSAGPAGTRQPPR